MKAAAPQTAEMNSPVYSSVLGLMDLTFDSIEHQEEQQDGFGSKLFSGFKKRRK